MIAVVAWVLTAATWFALRMLGITMFDSPIFGILLVGIPGTYLTYRGLKRGLRADKVTELYQVATISQADNVDLRMRLGACEGELAALKRKYSE